MSTPQAQNKHVGTSSRYLSFSLGEEQFAIPLLDVKEVIAMPEITPVPSTPTYFLGIMNLRGQIISVLDLRQKLGIKNNQQSETTVIICDFQSFSVGVVVDSVNSVFAAHEEEISTKIDIQGSKASEYISGVYRKEKTLVLILNIAKSLNLEDQAALSKATKKVA